MKITTDGKMYRAFRTSGPSSNMLGLEFGDAAQVQLEARVLSGAQITRIHGEDVQREVMRTMDAYNTSHGTNYRVARIEYVASDSPSIGVYELLTNALIEAAAAPRDP